MTTKVNKKIVLYEHVREGNLCWEVMIIGISKLDSWDKFTNYIRILQY